MRPTLLRLLLGLPLPGYTRAVPAAIRRLWLKLDTADTYISESGLSWIRRTYSEAGDH